LVSEVEAPGARPVEADSFLPGRAAEVLRIPSVAAMAEIY
jgi:hypothetical protein